MLIRQTIEEKENFIFIPEASFSTKTKGREKLEQLDEIRTCYMVDRDRIIHCKSFRRLKHKTQVFIRTSSDHYRTRLTHTLEVAQIAKTIGKGIGLNEDLIEAIALAHDIGHVAFAHNGEEVLNRLMPLGFKHNVNSVRVLTKIEKLGGGLNLTKEVLEGVLYHSGFSSKGVKADTLEGQVVRYSDKIAYVNHDIDDSIRAGLLSPEIIPVEFIKILGKTHGERIDTLVKSCIYTTLDNIASGNIMVSLYSDVEKALVGLRNFMFDYIYKGDKLKEEREKAKFVLEQVFQYYLKYTEKLPQFYIDIVEKEGAYQGVCDYISGMSDDYCLAIFNKLYVPKFIIY